MVHANELSEPWDAQKRGSGWFVLLLGVVVFALFGAVVGYAYLRGLPGIGGEPPLIQAEDGPYRTAPSDRGGIAVPNAKSSIVTVLRPQNEPPRVERLLPAEPAAPLESPEPETQDEAPVAALSAPEPAPAAVSPMPTPPPDAAETTAGVPVPTAPYPRSKPLAPGPSAEPAQPSAAIGALATVEPAAAPPVARAITPAPVEPEPAPPARAPAIVTIEPAPPPPPAAAAPAASAPVASPPASTAGPQRLVRTAPAATPAPARSSAGTGTGVYRLQLAAVRSEGGLTQAWADLRQRYPVALGGVNPQVERTDTTSGPLFRLQAGPFTSREAAVDACGTIRSSGGQCFIVGPIPQ